jgi:hypothetical protein
MSTKYEKLIEYIINDDEAKARELFHQIVVEKSRDIYESLIDEQDLEEVGGNPVGRMVDEISADEEGMQEDEEDAEDEDGISLDGDDDMGDDMGDMGGEGDMEDRVMDLEDALDELKAEFDALMAGENAEEHDHPGMHNMGGDDMGGEGDEMDGMMEAEDDEEDDDDDEEDLDESKKTKEDMLKAKDKKDSKKKMTEAEWIRENVEKIGEYPGEQAKPSGHMAGTGAKSEKQGERNTRSVTGPGADMGGTTKNTARGGHEADVFGKQIEQPSNEYTKGRGNLKDAGKFANVPGKDEGHTAYKTKAQRQPEANDPEKGKLVGNDGTRPINKKSPMKHIGK